MSKEKAMDVTFALFNCHINNAKDKAKKAFIKRFSQEDWDESIQPFIKKGIMSIFKNPPTELTKWYVEAVAIYVNEKRN